MVDKHLQPPSYLPQAVATTIGFAHPSGEQLNVTKGIADPIPCYKPNSGALSFLCDGWDGTFTYILQGDIKAQMYLLLRDKPQSVEWDFGDGSDKIESLTMIQEHVYPAPTEGVVTTYVAKAACVLADGSNVIYQVDVKVGAVEAVLPVISAAPVIEQPVVGIGCTSTIPTATGATSTAFVWLMNGLPISRLDGAEGNVLTPDRSRYGQMLRSRFIATNEFGSVFLDSNELEVEGFAPTNVAGTTNGDPVIGKPCIVTDVSYLAVPPAVIRGEFLIEGETVSTFGPFYGDFKPAQFIPALKDEERDLTVHVHVKNVYGEGTFEVDFGSISLEGGIGPNPPEQTVKGSIHGTPVVGGTLTYKDGTWTGAKPLTVSIEWLYDDESKTPKQQVVGSGQNYTPLPEHAGKSVYCRPVGKNVDGMVDGLLTDAVVINATPICEVQPKISGGRNVGDILTVDTGEWYGFPDLTITSQWYKNGQPVAGATAATYELLLEDSNCVIGNTVTVKANGKTALSEAYPRVMVASPDIPAVQGVPVQFKPGKITGTAVVGDTVTYTPGEWTGDAPITKGWRWMIGASEVVASQSQPTLVLLPEYQGKFLSVQSFASNSKGSNNGIAIGAGNIGLKPKVVNPGRFIRIPQVGYVMRVYDTVTEGIPPADVTFTWTIDGTPVAPEIANNPTYTVRPADEGKMLSCTVTAENIYGNDSADVTPVKVQGNNPVNIIPPFFKRKGTTEKVDQLIVKNLTPATYTDVFEVDPGTWDGDDYTYTYQYVNEAGTTYSAKDGLALSRVAAAPNRTFAPKVIAINADGNRATAQGDDLPVWKVPAISARLFLVEANNYVGATMRYGSDNSIGWNEYPAMTAYVVDVVDFETQEVLATNVVDGQWVITPNALGKRPVYRWTRTNAAGTTVELCVPAPGVTKAMVSPTMDTDFKTEYKVGPKKTGEDDFVIGSGTVIPGDPAGRLGTVQYQHEATPGSWTNFGATSGQFEAAPVSGKIGKFRTYANLRNSFMSPVFYSDAITVAPQDPELVETPTVVGVIQVGKALVATGPNTWYRRPYATGTTQIRWYLQASGGPKTQVGSNDYYVVLAADMGKTLSCESWFIRDIGGGFRKEIYSALLAEPSAPTFDTRPIITSASTVVPDAVFSLSGGSYGGHPTPTIAYQWRVDGTNISGETGATFKPADQPEFYGKAVSCVVTLTNASGVESTTITGNLIQSKPKNTALPTITGTARAGQTLTATAGTWIGNPGPVVTRQWGTRDTAAGAITAIAGATAATFVLTGAQVGKFIVVTETGSSPNGNVNVVTANTAAVVGVAPANTAAPTLAGTPIVGGQLTATAGTWTGTPAPTLAYAWFLLDTADAALTTPVAGQTAKTFTMMPAAEGKFVAVRETATNSAGNATAKAVTATAVTPEAPTDP